MSNELAISMSTSETLVWRLLGAALVLLSLGVEAEPWTPNQDDLVLEVLPKSLFSDNKLSENKHVGNKLAINKFVANKAAEIKPTEKIPEQIKNAIIDPELAAKTAAQYITQGRQQSDPRYFGYAQALIQPWWNHSNPPTEILLIRATLKQHNHKYAAAIKDLKTLTRNSPHHAQAWLTLSTIQLVQSQYKEAKQSCAALSRSYSSWLSTLCYGQVMAVTGKAEQGYTLINLLLNQLKEDNHTDRQWLHTLLAEISLRTDKTDQARQHFKAALEIPHRDPYLLRVYSEFLLLKGKAEEVFALLKNETKDDALLLQLAIAAKASKNKQLLIKYSSEFKARLTAAQLRGSTVHQREHAQFLLEIENQNQPALTLAKNNWDVQKEPTDARLLLAAAMKNENNTIIQEIILWKNSHQLQDHQMESMIRYWHKNKHSKRI